MSGKHRGDVGVVAMRTLTCRQCGMEWARPRSRGNPPTRCPDCRPQALPAPRSGTLDTNTAGYRLAAAVTTYRLAIEEATSALRLGRNAEALAALERVQAPARAMDKAAPYKRVIKLPA